VRGGWEWLVEEVSVVGEEIGSLGGGCQDLQAEHMNMRVK
jgi:hypothetical protein